MLHLVLPGHIACGPGCQDQKPSTSGRGAPAANKTPASEANNQKQMSFRATVKEVDEGEDDDEFALVPVEGDEEQPPFRSSHQEQVSRLWGAEDILPSNRRRPAPSSPTFSSLYSLWCQMPESGVSPSSLKVNPLTAKNHFVSPWATVPSTASSKKPSTSGWGAPSANKTPASEANSQKQKPFGVTAEKFDDGEDDNQSAAAVENEELPSRSTRQEPVLSPWNWIHGQQGGRGGRSRTPRPLPDPRPSRPMKGEP